MPRDCATCGQSLFKRDFSTNQWSKGEGTSRCKACVASLPHLLPQPHPRPTAAALSPTQVRQLAKSAHLVEVSHNEASKVISFERSGVRFNVYYTTGTVGTCLAHPAQGKTQLFRRNQDASGVAEIFRNPRLHTGEGYQQKRDRSDGDSGASAPTHAAPTAGGGTAATAIATATSAATGTAGAKASLPPRFLLVGGAMFDLADDFFVEALQRQLKGQGVAFDIMDAHAQGGAKLCRAAQPDSQYTCIVIFQLCAGGSEAHDRIALDAGAALAAWVHRGGQLFIGGEGQRLAEYFRTHFGKSWQMASYFRTCHELNASHASLTPALRTALPGGCNVKSMMVKNVPRTEQLYATTGQGQSQSMVFAPRSVEAGLCAMALGRHGKGHVLFFGDVNAEETTSIALLQLGLLLGDASSAGAGAGAAAAAAQPTAAPGDVCALPGCTKNARSRCARCSTAKYCSRECQKADWPRHKKQCKKKGKQDKGNAAGGGAAGGGAATANSLWARGLSTADQYEWLSNCYMMRCDDDYAWGGCNLHGPYDPQATAISNGKDFLAFCLFASFRGVIPAQWDWPAFLDSAAQFVCYAFEKSDAQERWGSENVFMAQMGGRSLRFTAMQVYGCGAEQGSPYFTGRPGEMPDQEQEVACRVEMWAKHVDPSNCDQFPALLDHALQRVGGVGAWATFLRKLAAKRYHSQIGPRPLAGDDLADDNDSDFDYDSDYDYDYDDDDGDDYGGGACGFTRAQCDELLAQGVKPWDDDAHAVLGALSDW